MNYQRIEQRSQEWWELKVGKISGTRFGQLISTRENTLIDDMANEILNGQCEWDDFENEDMLFGVENEPIAIELYEQQSGINFERGGVIISEKYPNIHMASPDAVNLENGVVLEIKCTQHGKTQINRFRMGVESKYMPQIINYFAVSDDIKEVHWVSYCPYRTERPLVIHIFDRNTIVEYKELKSGVTTKTIQDKVNESIEQLIPFQINLKELINKFKTIEF